MLDRCLGAKGILDNFGPSQIFERRYISFDRLLTGFVTVVSKISLGSLPFC
jgi:hypothetical protein